MHAHTSRLDDHDEVLVFEKNFQWNVLGLELGADRWWEFDFDLHSGFRKFIETQTCPVDGDDIAVLKEALDGGARGIGHVLHEPVVQTLELIFVSRTHREEPRFALSDLFGAHFVPLSLLMWWM